MDTNNKSKDITIQYSLVQASYWMGFACISAFSSVYLLSIGISNSLIGITLALGALVSAIIQPYVGILIDHHPKITTKKILLMASIIIILLALLLYPVSRGVPVIVPLMYGFLMLLLQLAQPFSNSIGMASINAGYKLHFGPARAIGSLGYALVALVLGKIAEAKGGDVVPGFIAISFTLTMIFLFIYPLREENNIGLHNDEENQDSKRPGLMDFFKKYKALGIMTAGLVFIFFSHVVLNSFGLQIIETKGGSSESMGVATAISATIEVVPMFLFPILKKRFKVSDLLKLSAVFFTLKVLVTLLAPNIMAYYLAQGCQMLGWGIMAVAIVYYVNDIVDEKDTAQGQAYSGMALTIGNVLGNLVGGKVIDSLGINALLILGFVAAFFGTCIFFSGINMSVNRKETETYGKTH